MNNDLPRTLRLATLWLLLGVTMFVGVQWWQHRAQQTRFTANGEVVEIRRGGDGSHHLQRSVNVQRLRVVALPGLGSNPLLGMEVLGKLRWQQRDAVLRIEVDRAR